MVQIYSPKTSSRLEYILSVLFNDFLSIPYKLVDHQSDLQKNIPVINYSEEVIEDSLQIPVSGFLLQTTITDEIPSIDVRQTVPVLFPSIDKSDISFDLFSAAFYMLTRYEEYFNFNPDQHNRFRAEDSLAHKHGFLELPVVDHWIKNLVGLLNSKFNLNCKKNQFQFISTFDIDIAYALRTKSFPKQVFSVLRSFSKADTVTGTRKLKSMMGMEIDIYDTFQYIQGLQEKYHHPLIFFFLLGDKGPFDKNLNPETIELKELIKSLSSKFPIGIHPSYESNNSSEKLTIEISRLKNIISKDITLSRQHYLKLRLPDTYRNLLKNGIQEDYTMGFASLPGFRSGTTRPYYFYDLSKETSTSLLIQPFAYMDGTLKSYLKLTPEKALEKIKSLINQVRKVDGNFISLWHNQSLSETEGWEGWRFVYEGMLQEVYK